MSFRESWVGVGVSASLLFGALSLHLARQQWATALYPHLAWTRGQEPESKLGLALADGQRLWCVDVANLGGGLAVIDRITYDVELVDEPQSRREGVAFTEMLDVVESTGFRDELDFVLTDWHRGFALRGSDLTHRLWELPVDIALRIKVLDAHVFYRSRFGDLYETTLQCIPARGLPPEPTPAPRPRARPAKRQRAAPGRA